MLYRLGSPASRMALLATWVGVLGASQAVRAADKSPAYTTPAEAGDDYFLQGEYSGSLDSVGQAGLQIIAEGKGTYRAYLLSGGLPGAGWNHSDRFELVGKREGTVLALQIPNPKPSSDSVLVTVGTA